ncbi:uncharacterized protein LOC126736271 [Anthonomus grandis grandis]|uniref:uncharacterized protein LOC126736271 n=1 Tax=Anthonomus grandis grandis TaxID=2921223 RepID=UPI0021664AB3|nr:uncharacterized protein LOC126736271 [Anthonomus grandis grandis]
MPKNKSQKILIPRGTIDPNEDTLIEIPKNLQERPVVVASRGPNQTHLSFRSDHIGPSNISSQYAPMQTTNPNITLGQTYYEPAAANTSTFYQPQPIPTRNQVPIRTDDSFSPTHNSTVHSPNYYSSHDISASLLADLNTTELEEKSLVQQKLEAFQEARRQFLLETTTMVATSTSPSASSCYTNESVFDQTYSGHLPQKKKKKKSGCLDTSKGSSSSIKSNCSQRRSSRRVQAKIEDSEDEDDDANVTCVCPSKSSIN